MEANFCSSRIKLETLKLTTVNLKCCHYNTRTWHIVPSQTCCNLPQTAHTAAGSICGTWKKCKFLNLSLFIQHIYSKILKLTSQSGVFITKYMAVFKEEKCIWLDDTHHNIETARANENNNKHSNDNNALLIYQNICTQSKKHNWKKENMMATFITKMWQTQRQSKQG